ncbi:hypothetical protein FHK02_1386 [Spirosoma sp. LMG 31448]|uniref:DNA-binding protein n=1 Tax=Spirosoma utsteinense TaxID=2585773 RepID=A0ABR6W1J5_9BACT|nr:hypothetical protein [Spirosoma utsteinense]MBC3790449.1 hypothetical protein [Spirosoma utsteinense]
MKPIKPVVTNESEFITSIYAASHELVDRIFSELQDLRSRVELVEALQFVWLTRSQTMILLDISSTKIWELKKSGEIITSGSLYSYKSCREYLDSKTVSKEVIKARLADVIAKKDINMTKQPGKMRGNL